jgi:phospholipid/cholesterol/gamma-HCH transport system substrate-binding protein
MNKFSLEAKVGLFFVITIAIFAYVWLSVLELGVKEGFVLKARFRSVEGLVNGAQVQIAGIKVGSVKDITFDPESGKAVAQLEIKDAYRSTIPEDSKVFLKTKGLLGDRYVVIEPGKPNLRKLKPGEELTSVFEPTDPEKLVEGVGIITQDVQALTREARRQIIDEKGGQKVDEIVNDTGAFMKNLNQLLSRNTDKIERTIDNSAEATRNVNEIVSRNKDKLNRTVDDLERFSRSMDKTGDRFAKSSKDLESLAADIRSGRGTLGKLVTDETLHKEAYALVHDLRGLTNSIRHGPGAVSRLINDPELYLEARRAVRNMNKTAEDISEATPISTLAIILGSVFR